MVGDVSCCSFGRTKQSCLAREADEVMLIRSDEAPRLPVSASCGTWLMQFRVGWGGRIASEALCSNAPSRNACLASECSADVSSRSLRLFKCARICLSHFQLCHGYYARAAMSLPNPPACQPSRAERRHLEAWQMPHLLSFVSTVYVGRQLSTSSPSLAFLMSPFQTSRARMRINHLPLGLVDLQ